MNENANNNNNQNFEGGFDAEPVNVTPQQQTTATAPNGFRPLSFYQRHKTACNIGIGIVIGAGIGYGAYRILGDRIGRREAERAVKCGIAGATAAAGIAANLATAQPTYIEMNSVPVNQDQFDPNMTDFTEA